MIYNSIKNEEFNILSKFINNISLNNKSIFKKSILNKKLSLYIYNVKKLKFWMKKKTSNKNSLLKKKFRFKFKFFKSLNSKVSFNWKILSKKNLKAKAKSKNNTIKYLRIISKKLKKTNASYNGSNYLNMHFLYQDFFINKLINLVLLKNGCKYKAFSIFHNVLILLKKITNISPVRLIKSILKIDKMVVTYYTKKTRYKLKRIPKLNTKKNLYLKYLVLIKNTLSSLKINKHYHTSEKLAYVIISNLLTANANWKKLIRDNIQTSQLYDQKRLLLYKKY